LQVTAAPPEARRQQALEQIRGLADVDPSGVARVKLIGGHLGADGAVLIRRLTEAVPEGDTARLMYFDMNTGVWRTVPSTLSDDRRTVRAQVHHFSDWAAAILRDAADLLGSRADAPNCGKTPRPSWVDAVTFLDDQNAPLRVCGAGDPDHTGRVRVKVAVNRGYGLSMHTAIDPSHISVDLGEGPIDLLADGAIRMPTFYNLISKRDHETVPVLARQTATYSFTEAQVRASVELPLVQAELTAPEAAAGTIFGLIIGEVTHGTGDSRIARVGAYLGAYMIVAQCVGDIAKPFSEGRWTHAITGARKCFSDTANTVTTLTARSLAEAFPHESESKLAGISAKVGNALRTLVSISGGFGLVM
jgi:hypothetical protein